MNKKNSYHQFYDIIKQVPFGRVATYGQIASLANKPRHSRQVGYALAALKDQQAHDIPWHRIVNARGEISQRTHCDDADYQRVLLESEHINFDKNNRISLTNYLWQTHHK